jgi:hypothetical protein
MARKATSGIVANVFDWLRFVYILVFSGGFRAVHDSPKGPVSKVTDNPSLGGGGSSAGFILVSYAQIPVGEAASSHCLCRLSFTGSAEGSVPRGGAKLRSNQLAICIIPKKMRRLQWP